MSGLTCAWIRCGGHREVEGVRLPFRVESQWPMVGSMLTQCDSVEANLDRPAETFDLPAG